MDPEKVSEQKLYYGALAGIVGSVEDPYSVFFEPKVSEEFENEISGNFEGIGAEIGIRNNRLISKANTNISIVLFLWFLCRTHQQSNCSQG